MHDDPLGLPSLALPDRPQTFIPRAQALEIVRGLLRDTEGRIKALKALVRGTPHDVGSKTVQRDLVVHTQLATLFCVMLSAARGTVHSRFTPVGGSSYLRPAAAQDDWVCGYIYTFDRRPTPNRDRIWWHQHCQYRFEDIWDGLVGLPDPAAREAAYRLGARRGDRRR